MKCVFGMSVSVCVFDVCACMCVCVHAYYRFCFSVCMKCHVDPINKRISSLSNQLRYKRI